MNSVSSSPFPMCQNLEIISQSSEASESPTALVTSRTAVWKQVLPWAEQGGRLREEFRADGGAHAATGTLTDNLPGLRAAPCHQPGLLCSKEHRLHSRGGGSSSHCGAASPIEYYPPLSRSLTSLSYRIAPDVLPSWQVKVHLYLREQSVVLGFWRGNLELLFCSQHHFQNLKRL